MERKVDGYQVFTLGYSPKRRETESGAIKLAEKLRKERKHGTVVRNEWDENGVYFVEIMKF